jgi:hypothetical protein
MKLRLTPDAASSTANALFITGSMRSGTTMMMRLVASLHDVEMFNEPPVLYALFPLLTDIDTDIWSYLFDCTLFEDRLIMSLRGKNLNLNRGDDACIMDFKTEQDVNARLKSSDRRASIVKSAKGRTIAFKLPEMTHLLPKYRLLRPLGKQIVMLREPAAVVASMIARGYYCDAEIEGTPVKWPLHTASDGNFPFWLPYTEHETWRRMDQLARCYRAYVFQYQHYVESDNDIVVDYDSFVANPHRCFSEVTAKLGFRDGELTDQLLSKVKHSTPDKSRLLVSTDSSWARKASDIYRDLLEKHRCAKSTKM